MELARGVKWFVVALVVWATLVVAAEFYFHRYTTNTAGGRFYRTDRWRGVTLVIEKNGATREF